VISEYTKIYHLLANDKIKKLVIDVQPKNMKCFAESESDPDKKLYLDDSEAYRVYVGSDDPADNIQLFNLVHVINLVSELVRVSDTDKTDCDEIQWDFSIAGYQRLLVSKAAVNKMKSLLVAQIKTKFSGNVSTDPLRLGHADRLSLKSKHDAFISALNKIGFHNDNKVCFNFLLISRRSLVGLSMR
jgi:hypothetical protein